MKKLISIILPVYNSAITLEKALGSIRRQNYSKIEVIIVDGASQDHTWDIVKSNADLVHKMISEPDFGVYDAMNKGAKLATGQWLYFLGADDILNNCLHEVANYLKNPHTIYYGDVILSHENKLYAGPFKWHTLVSKNINHQSIFYPRQVFEQYAYNLNYPILADYDLNLRLWGEGKFRFQYMPVVVAVHNCGGMSHQKQDEAFLHDKPALVNRYFGRRIILRAGWHRIRGLGSSLIRALTGTKQ